MELAAGITEQELRAACSTLGISENRTLTRAAARAAMRHLATQCHPDGSGNGDTARYTSVMSAYRLIEMAVAGGDRPMPGPDMFIGKAKVAVTRTFVVDDELDRFLAGEAPNSSGPTASFSPGASTKDQSKPESFAPPSTTERARTDLAAPGTMTPGIVRSSVVAAHHELLVLAVSVVISVAVRAAFVSYQPFGVPTVRTHIVIVAVVAALAATLARGLRYRYWYVTPMCLSVAEALPIVLIPVTPIVLVLVRTRGGNRGRRTSNEQRAEQLST